MIQCRWVPLKIYIAASPPFENKAIDQAYAPNSATALTSATHVYWPLPDFQKRGGASVRTEHRIWLTPKGAYPLALFPVHIKKLSECGFNYLIFNDKSKR